MKLFKKRHMIILSLVILVICMFLVGINLYLNHKNSALLKEAHDLSKDGFLHHDNNLTRQAIIKYSIWLQRNHKNPNRKFYADVLRSRGNNYLSLMEYDKAIIDLQESVNIYPVGEIQFGICLIEKSRGNLSALHNCYVKSANIYEKKKTPKTDITFTLAKILSGDKSAIKDYKSAYQTATGNKKYEYKGIAEAFLDKITYEEILH